MKNVSVLAVLVLTCWAQNNQPTPSLLDKAGPVFINGEPVYAVGGDVKGPRPVYSPDPEYSEEARRAKLQGTCVLWVVVGKDGKSHDVRIDRSPGMGLGEKSVEAIRAWRFEPAKKDGQPVAAQIKVETNFRLYPPGVPAILDFRSENGTEPSLAGKDADRYPLLVDISFVTGRKTDEGYVVTADASIPEGGQERKASITCGPKGTCFMLNSGMYPARWLKESELELIGWDDKDKVQKAHFVVVPAS